VLCHSRPSPDDSTAPQAGITYEVEARCRVLDKTRVSLLFVGGRVQPRLLPSPLGAALPDGLISSLQGLAGELVYLETTYLDADFRIAVWQRRRHTHRLTRLALSQGSLCAHTPRGMRRPITDGLSSTRVAPAWSRPRTVRPLEARRGRRVAQRVFVYDRSKRSAVWTHRRREVEDTCSKR
jgi:hypothetical protein